MQVGVGIIGLDNWYHVPLVAGGILKNSNARLVAISDSNEARVREAAKEYGAKKWYVSHEQLLKDPDVDAVLIETCTSTHCEIAETASELGKHMLIEKPIAATVKEAEKIIESAQKANVKLLTQYPSRFSTTELRVKEMIDKGIIGKPRAAVTTVKSFLPEDWPGSGTPGWYADPTKAVGGGFIDHSVHYLDVMRWLFNSDLKMIYAQIDKFVTKDLKVDDYGISISRLKNGALCTVECTWTSKIHGIPGMTDLTQIVGEKGDLSMSKFKSMINFYGEDEPYNERVILELPAEPGVAPFERLVDHFIECIVEDKTPLVTGEDGKAALKASLAAYRSAEENRPIDIS